MTREKKYEFIASKVANVFGVTIVKRLGTGAYGVAFLLSSGKVLKITRDFQEYITSTKLIGNRYIHMNTIFDTFIVTTSGWDDFYAIHQDYVEVNKGTNDIYKNLGRNLVRDSVLNGEIDVAKFEALILDSRNEEKKYSIDWLGMANEILDSKLFERVDLHSGNFGVRNGRLCMIDFGCSLCSRYSNLISEAIENGKKIHVNYSDFKIHLYFIKKPIKKFMSWLIIEPLKVMKSIPSIW